LPDLAGWVTSTRIQYSLSLSPYFWAPAGYGETFAAIPKRIVYRSIIALPCQVDARGPTIFTTGREEKATGGDKSAGGEAGMALVPEVLTA